jgi:hypothetical protein
MPASHSPRRQRNWQNLFASQTKKGPRRYHRDGMETQERSALRRDPVTRNPTIVTALLPEEAASHRHLVPSHAQMHRDGYVRFVTQGPVRMKLPKLRRVKRLR